MNQRIIKQLVECEEHLTVLEKQNIRAKDDIGNCVGGSLKKGYMDSCELVERRIEKIRNELQELQKLLLLSEG